MEETDMCHPIPTTSPLHQQIVRSCLAKALAAPQRQTVALAALASSQTVTQVARDHKVSRKFVYQQVHKAQDALDKAFSPAGPTDDHVLFKVPVTKAWLKQLVLGLTLICHSSCRGVVELLRDLLDFRMSVGTVHNILQAVVQQAQHYNDQQDLSNVRLGAHDELFQAGQPVLVGADVVSTYCYLLSLEEHRDADTWAIRLLELQDRGFHPEATIADFGRALRAGQALALAAVPCRGDVFHLLQELEPLVGFLENRAYEAMAACSRLALQQAEHRRRYGRADLSISKKLSYARLDEAQALTLASDVALLVKWLRCDVLAVAGPAAACRCDLYDFIVAELRSRVPLCQHRLEPVCRLLANQRDEVLAFAVSLDQDLAALAMEFQVPEPLVRHLLNVQTMDVSYPRRWQEDAALRRHLGERYHPLQQATQALARATVRASSVIENLNSRLRSYFFLRRHLGAGYLALLQFFLNHRCFLRSEHAERVGRSPSELLTGQAHPHWLEMLGYSRFSRN
jgi:hypothetical protein